MSEFRAPLTGEQRAKLASRYEAGDHSSVLGAGDGSPLDITAYAHLGRIEIEGASYEPLAAKMLAAELVRKAVACEQAQQAGFEQGELGYFEPETAYRAAYWILVFADAAEYGMGEWRNGVWVPHDV